MKNFIIGFLIAGVIGTVAVGSYFYGKQQTKTNSLLTPTGIISLSPTQPMVGNDKDEHGCIGSAGYSWCAEKNKCLRVWEEPCPTPTVAENTVELIKQALIKKNNWTNFEVEVTINKNDGTYAAGSVKEKGSMVGGGYFFAKKVNGEWIIVADGNGVITCASLVPYPDYPASLISECYDEKTSTTIKR